MRSFIAAAIDKVRVCRIVLTKLFLNSLRISIITVKNFGPFFLKRREGEVGKEGCEPSEYSCLAGCLCSLST